MKAKALYPLLHILLVVLFAWRAAANAGAYSGYLQALLDGTGVIAANLAVLGVCLAAVGLSAWVVYELFARPAGVRGMAAVSLSLSGAPVVLALISLAAIRREGLFVLLMVMVVVVVKKLNHEGHEEHEEDFFEVPDETGLSPHFPLFYRFFLRVLRVLRGSFFSNEWSIGALVCALMLLVKMGYIAGLAFPLNPDSVIHTQLVGSLRAAGSVFQLPYYHYGFHAITAAAASLSGASVMKTFLIFGQLLQVMAPISLYYPVHAAAGSRMAAWAAVLAAGLALRMPAQATSWGKYPALLAAVAAVFVLFLVQMLAGRSGGGAGRLALYGAAAGAAVLLHSRMAVVILLGGAALLLARPILRRPPGGRGKLALVIAAYLLVAGLAGLFALERLPGLSSALRPYAGPLGLALIVLLPFSVLYSFDAVLNMILFAGLSLLALGIPAPQLDPIGQATRLFDRPFLSILLFIPAGVLLGLGLAGLAQWTRARMPQYRAVSAGLLILFVLAFFPNPAALKPLAGASLAGPNDALLFEEIERRLPPDARIAIPNAAPFYELGTDGGAWIFFATGRETVKIPAGADLSAPAVLDEICRSGARYVYAGSRPRSFSGEQISSRAGWYLPEIVYPDVRLYQIAACK